MFINISYYRFGKIFLNEEGIATMVENYGLLGYPLTHTMSPPIHYALFDLYGRKVDYQVFELPPEQLDQHIPELFGLLGFNITIPHKVGIIPYLDRLDETAKRYNSVNLVKCEKEKVGYNTDVIGFTKSIEQLGASLNSRVLLLGCGGVGRMIAIETALKGGELTIAVRPNNIPLAEQAISEIRAFRPDAKARAVLIDRITGTYDLTVNATPAGMFPKVDNTPVGEDVVSRTSYLFDVIYNPGETKLMKMAKAQGVKTLGGMAMLVWQAAAAHTIWNGVNFKVEDIEAITAEMERRIANGNT